MTSLTSATTTETTFSNLVTPPDFVDDPLHNVIVIDPDWLEVEDLALFLKTAEISFNVYVYKSEMNDNDWVQKAIKMADTIIVKTTDGDDEFTVFKDKLACKETVYYYGSKNFLKNNNRINAPIDFFAKYISDRNV